MSWKNVSSFSQNTPRDERTPNSWQLTVGRLRLNLHHYFHDKGKWFVTCEPFFSMRQIGVVGDDVDALKRSASALLEEALNQHKSALDAVS